MTLTPIFRWYDFWIGAYWSRRDRKLYVLPLPCLGIVVDFGPPDSLALTIHKERSP